LIIQYVADLMLDASDSDSDAEIPVSEDESKLRLHETHLVPQWLDENSSEERSIRELKSETASVSLSLEHAPLDTQVMYCAVIEIPSVARFRELLSEVGGEQVHVHVSECPSTTSVEGQSYYRPIQNSANN